MQPNIVKGNSFGHVIIDIVKDANAKDWPPIVLDINNITINQTQGKHTFAYFFSSLFQLKFLRHQNDIIHLGYDVKRLP